jgi:hypothetical protein
MTHFDLALQTCAALIPDGDHDNVITDYVGVVRAVDERGTAGNVGKVRAYRINAEIAAVNAIPLSAACQAHSSAMRRWHAALYDPKGYEFQGLVAKQFEAFDLDCLVLDFILISPRWRGLKLGLLVARRMIDVLGRGCGLAVCEPSPILPDAFDELHVPRSWLPRQPTRRSRDEAAKKLRGHFRQMGFRRIQGTPFLGLSLTLQAPRWAELLQPSARKNGQT